MQFAKYIKTDLEQAEKLQICALNNILSCIENHKKLPTTNISSISMNIIDKVINERYGSYDTDSCKLDYVVYIPNSNYAIQIDFLIGKKLICKY